MQSFQYDTPQTERSDEAEVKNNAGGYVYATNDRLRRFLVLGCDGSTYYTNRNANVKDNLEYLRGALKADPTGYVDEVLHVNLNALAPKVDTQLFALALASVEGDAATRKRVLGELSSFCRTGTHLFNFLEYRKQLGGGWGKLVRDAVKGWYSRDAHQVAHQVAKYRQRDGWSHRDVLRLAHPKPLNEVHDAVFEFATSDVVTSRAPEILKIHRKVTEAKSAKEVCDLIDEHPKMVMREFIPTQFLTDAMVWRKLIKDMPLMAMVRNLRNMHKHGAMNGHTTRMIVNRLQDEEVIRRSRMHPVHFLLALSAFAEASAAIQGALEGAFYLAFKNVEPTGKRIMIAMDVSGSMHLGAVAGTNLTPAQVSMAMAMVTVNVDDCDVFGFGTSFKSLPFVKPGSNLNSLVRKVRGMSFGGTDCALPMRHARQLKKEYDAFVIYTDNETWAGATKPMNELRSYRRQFVKDAKLIVVGMTSSGFSIADPRDPLTLDVVGFDASAPQVISQTISA